MDSIFLQMYNFRTYTTNCSVLGVILERSLIYFIPFSKNANNLPLRLKWTLGLVLTFSPHLRSLLTPYPYILVNTLHSWKSFQNLNKYLSRIPGLIDFDPEYQQVLLVFENHKCLGKFHLDKEYHVLISFRKILLW